MQNTEGWMESTMPFLVCGTTIIGYKNADGDIKYQCHRCKSAMVRKTKGRRHFTIECYTGKERSAANILNS